VSTSSMHAPRISSSPHKLMLIWTFAPPLEPAPSASRATRVHLQDVHVVGEPVEDGAGEAPGAARRCLGAWDVARPREHRLKCVSS
jgi:hypothetical protein